MGRLPAGIVLEQRSGVFHLRRGPEQIDPDAGHHLVGRSLHEDAADFLLIDLHIVGPLQDHIAKCPSRSDTSHQRERTHVAS